MSPRQEGPSCAHMCLECCCLPCLRPPSSGGDHGPGCFLKHVGSAACLWWAVFVLCLMLKGVWGEELGPPASAWTPEGLMADSHIPLLHVRALGDQPTGFERGTYWKWQVCTLQGPTSPSLLGRDAGERLWALRAWLRATAVSNCCGLQAASPSSRHLLPSLSSSALLPRIRPPPLCYSSFTEGLPSARFLP